MRLTIRTVDNDICYEVKKDPEGAYNILDLARYTDDGDGEEADILLAISNRLAAYEDTGVSPKQVKALQQENEQLRAQVAKMSDAIQKYILSIEKQYSIEDHHKCPICGIFTKTEYCHMCVTKELINAMSNAVQDYHTPADVKALKKTREALKLIKKYAEDGCTYFIEEISNEALAEIDKVIGGNADV